MTNVDYNPLGSTGLIVSRICLGTMSFGSPDWRTWVLDEAASRPFIAHALELGVNFFDTADMYSVGRSEEILGQALRDFARRDEVVIATKVYNPMGDRPNQRGLGRKHIMHAIDASLRRLQTDYVDLYQIHRWDDQTPIEETMEALHDVVRAGKALYIGASSMRTWQFATAVHLAERRGWTPFVSMQNHYNLAYRDEEQEMIPFCRAEAIGLIPWSPLASGYLTHAPDAGTTRQQTDPFAQHAYSRPGSEVIRARVHELAAKYGVPAAQVALAWVLRQPGVSSVIVGATKPHHVDDAVTSLSVALSDEDAVYLEQPYHPYDAWLA